MSTRSLLFGLLFACTQAIVSGQDADRQPLSGPSMGLVFDEPTRALRPITGVPGASTLGARVAAGLDCRMAAIPAGQDFVLAVTGDGLEVVLLHPGPEEWSKSTIPGVPPNPDRIVLSPSGSAAVLHYVDRAKALILRGLPNQVVLGLEVDIAGPAPVIAVSDDGQALLYSAASGSGDTLFVADQDSARPIMQSEGVSAASFLHRGRDALVAAKAENRLYLLRDVTAAAAGTVLADSRDGLDSPVSVAASLDNRRALVAGAAGVWYIDLAGGDKGFVSCDCAPSSLQRLEGNSIFQLTQPADGPIWIFDGDSPEPRIVFSAPVASAALDGSETVTNLRPGEGV